MESWFGGYTNYNLEPVCPLFWGFNPPKEGLFLSKTVVIWVPGISCWAIFFKPIIQPAHRFGKADDEPRPCYRPFPCWFVPCHPPSHPDSGWWLNQPICKICSSKRIISPIVGVKRKNIRNHHLVVESVTSCQTNLPANFWNGRLRWEIEKPWKITRLALSWLGKPFLRVHLRWACINISLVTPPPRMTCGKWRVRLGFPTKTMYGNPGGDKTTSSG